MPDILNWQPREEHIPPAPIPLPALIWQTLYARGYRTPVEIEPLLRPSLKSLRSPLLLPEIAPALDRLVKAYERQELVCVYADFDLDGSSGLALLKTGLRMLGFRNVRGYQPKRLSEGYGVHSGAIHELIKQGVELLITVDVGTTAYEALSEARKAGLDVIVTDHHLPDDSGLLPPAVALINPNAHATDHPLGHLAGVGVAYYLLLALKGRLRELGVSVADFSGKELLDYFVVGTLTDMVPLKDENRPLVRHGLWQLTNTKRAGLRALLEALDLGNRELTSQDVALRFAPKLNALSRLESDLRPIDLFLEEDLSRARELAEKVLRLNEERVRLQRAAEAAARVAADRQNDRAALVVVSPDFHRGVVGLVATRLAQEYKRPAFVGAVEGDGRIVGSARLPGDEFSRSQSLVEALQRAKSALQRFGGHSQAAGFETNVADVEAMHRFVDEYFASQGPKGAPVSYYDAVAPITDVDSELMKWQESLEPFGAEFAVPVFRLQGAVVRATRELRGGHLRVEVGAERGRQTLNGICFSPLRSVAERAVVGSRVDVLATVEWNHYLGRKTLQLGIRDLLPTL